MIKVIGRLYWAPLLIGAAFWLMWTSDGRCDGDRLLRPTRIVHDTTTSPNTVRRRCLTPEGNDERLAAASTTNRWSLPSHALAADFDTTIHCLVLRYNFQYETTDDPNTTGRGTMDFSRPLDTLTDSAYIVREGYLVDPPPHDSLYFDAHMQSLNRYWETVSGGRIHLTWDIYPPYRDSVYQLPHPMSYYGRCELRQVIAGLEDYFVDCIELADSVEGDAIDFSDYQAFFLFHAGSDAQSDIGWPSTCEDLFTGFIKFGDTVWVDDSTHMVRSALMMPETTVQDGRITALNAVLAHEFGHQLGLVDMYSTESFFTQLGDFSLMDNNGFGTGIEFPGFWAGNVFGAVPVMPDAWSRAFLGVDEVADFRSDTVGVEIAATGLNDDPGLKIARLPISESEYYLIENRLEDVDGHTVGVRQDSATSVFMGPSDAARRLTGAYDFLMPGSGALIYHVDEEVAGLDYDGDGVNNFADNQLQWSVDDRKFVSLVEADGIVNFGGYYYAGYGDQGDFFRDDQANAFTPNTNPETVDNSGNETHFYIENIGRKVIPGGRDEHYVTLDFSIDRKVTGFPVRAGYPWSPLPPIADDLTGDGSDEVIIASGPYLTVVTGRGKNFIDSLNACPACRVYDSVSSSVNPGSAINPREAQPVPVFCDPLPRVIGQFDAVPGPDTAQLVYTSGPVTGRAAPAGDEKLVAVGYSDANPLFIGRRGWVTLYLPHDNNVDARADVLDSVDTKGLPMALSFGDTTLYAFSVLTSATIPPEVEWFVNRWSVLEMQIADTGRSEFQLSERDIYDGICRLGNDLVVMATDTASGGSTWLYVISDQVDSTLLDGLYVWGPVAADMNRDGDWEVAAFTPDGEAVLVTVGAGTTPSFTVLSHRQTNHLILTAPAIGDIDLDGYPEIVVGGQNELLAFSADLTIKTDFPLSVDDRFPSAAMVAAPVIADIASTGTPEIAAASDRGNFYAFDPAPSYGFPLSSGEQQFGNATPAVLFSDSEGGKIGWLGGDGWFYAWEADEDSITNFWPMGGCKPAGTYALETAKLPSPAPPTTVFDDAKFYNYPNPVMSDETTIRYFLGADARSVMLNIFDLSGRRVAQLDGGTRGGTDNEVTWRCTDVATGVYRCVIKVDFASGSETAFKDIAVIR